MTKRYVDEARALLDRLVEERRAAIAADAGDPGQRLRGGLPQLQAEIEAVEAALADEKKRAKKARKHEDDAEG